jgi:hypothetical protein
MSSTISAHDFRHDVRMEKAARASGDSGPEGEPARAPGALVMAGLLALVDLLFLSIAVAFGPEGFGGDGTPAHSDRLRSSIGEWAGISALGLALVAVIVALLVRAPVRHRALTAVVACEAVSVLVLIVSTLG